MNNLHSNAKPRKADLGDDAKTSRSEDTSLSHSKFWSLERTETSSISSFSDQDNEDDEKRFGWKEKWSVFIIRFIHVPLICGIHFISGVSARNPIRVMAFISFVSFLLLGIGYTTNFTMNANKNSLWTPRGSFVNECKEWMDTESRFGSQSARRHLSSIAKTRYFIIMMHGYGTNILGQEQARLAFNVSDTMLNLPGYSDVCLEAGVYYTLPNGTEIVTCGVSGMMRFWSFSSLLFDLTINSDEQVIEKLSMKTYPDGEEVRDHYIYGKTKRDKETGLLKSLESFYLVYALPDTNKARDAEKDYIKAILRINDEWQKDELQKARISQSSQGVSS
jgi:hypothetical protein